MSNRGVIKRNVNTAELVGLSFGDGSFISRPNTNKFRFQLRIGNYRAILDIIEQKLIVHVIEVGHMKNIYK